jgi:CelD/BcsL family acetyltransferase involved in cellulose biosynthesis
MLAINTIAKERPSLMAVRVVDSLDALLELRPIWSDVFQTMPDRTPFQSWEWNFAWCKQLHASSGLRIFVVEDGGRCVGIAPFFRRRSLYGWPLSRLGLLGEGRSDYLDFIVRPGIEPTFFRELFEAVRDGPRDFRLLELQDMPDSPRLSACAREAKQHFPFSELRIHRPCVTIPLPRSWEEYVRSLGRRSRQDVGYDRRYLDRSFRVELRIATEPASVRRGSAELIAIYRSRWATELGATRFDREAAVKLEMEVAALLSAAGWYRLYVLDVDGAPAAALSGSQLGRRYFVDTFAHSPAFQRYSVGNVLLGRVIEHCIEEGCEEIDLTRGDEPYKLRWGGQRRMSYRVRAGTERWSMALAAAAEHAYRRASSSTILKRLQARYLRLRYGRGRRPVV